MTPRQNWSTRVKPCKIAPHKWAQPIMAVCAFLAVRRSGQPAAGGRRFHGVNLKDKRSDTPRNPTMPTLAPASSASPTTHPRLRHHGRRRLLVLMDDWLARGGRLGAALGFALGGLLLLPVGYVYGQWVPAFARCGRRSRLHPASVSAHRQLLHRMGDAPRLFIVCPWESGSHRKSRRVIFPSLNCFALYSVAASPCFFLAFSSASP